MEAMPVEKATRHIYNALSKSWTKDEVLIKIEEVPFDSGAMRVCYRMKKMDNYCPNADWKSELYNIEILIKSRTYTNIAKVRSINV